ncbi:hypothetical protein PR002_g29313 [Phytophthora rubi]|uniref:Uncharacterized protein n=2 Tax=Phytophthora rubi TaxID=129364 RepID=A0A6A3H288_9STRA|nr:hypothetical protein PR002_g29313 [Phytophthora rubi]
MSVSNQPPPPPSQGDGLRDLRPLLTPRSHGDDPRDLPLLDNINPGGRYDDKELAEHTKALVSSPLIKLPNLHSKADYKSWRSEVPLHFDTRMLGAVTYGTERYDEAEGLRRAKYHEWFGARKNKAFSALALSVDLRTTFKIDDIRDNMDAAVLLFTRITQHNGEFTEWQHASLLLPNCVEVYLGLAREHGDWINNHGRRSLTVAEAVQRLRAIEHQREQLRGQTGQSSSLSLKVSHVSAGQGQGQGTSRKRSKQLCKRCKNVADKKQKNELC